MKPDRMVLSTLIPLLSLISVAIIGLGIGGIFIAINDHWWTIGIGMALVVGVPFARRRRGGGQQSTLKTEPVPMGLPEASGLQQCCCRHLSV